MALLHCASRPSVWFMDVVVTLPNLFAHTEGSLHGPTWERTMTLNNLDPRQNLPCAFTWSPSLNIATQLQCRMASWNSFCAICSTAEGVTRSSVVLRHLHQSENRGCLCSSCLRSVAVQHEEALKVCGWCGSAGLQSAALIIWTNHSARLLPLGWYGSVRTFLVPTRCSYRLKSVELNCVLLPDTKMCGNFNVQDSLCRHEMVVSVAVVPNGNTSGHFEGTWTTAKYVTPFTGQSKLTCNC